VSAGQEVKNIVLVRGGFVDGSGWQGVYDHLTADGYRVTVVQNPTLSLAGDVAATHLILDGLDGPAVLVGHSYGGAVITEAGNHPNVAALAYIQAQRAASFSVRNWVRTGSGSLFVPYQANQIAALRSIIATWMRLAIVETMSHPEEDQRLWFIVDELDSLGAIEGLKDALARLRKFGGRCVLGFQSIAQVSATYGGGEAQTIVENCGNTLILRCAGSEHGGTSQFASRLIGEREVIRRHTARGRDREGLFAPRGARRSTNVSEQHVVENAVLAAELEQLPDLSGYLKTAAAPHWLRVSFRRAG